MIDPIARYTFNKLHGNFIPDESGVGQSLDLKVNDPDGEISWLDQGGIALSPVEFKGFENRGTAVISTEGPANKIIEACKASNQLTIEVWAMPDILAQAGPCRIASISSDPGNRNLTFSYQNSCYDIRLRTTGASVNGLPAYRNIDGDLVQCEPTHIVYTYSNPGSELYINGKRALKKLVDGQVLEPLSGDFSNWSDGYRLIIGNEWEGMRAFKGELYHLSYYDKPLSSSDVAERYTTAFLNRFELAGETV